MKLQDIKKVCWNCKARCCKMGGPDFTEKEMLKIIKEYPENQKKFIKINDDHYELKIKDGYCPFLLKNYSCSVHKLRPLMCKCWPVYIEYKKNKKRPIIIQCPLTPYLSRKQLEIMKKQALKVPRELVEFLETNLPKKEYELCVKRFKSFNRKKLK